MTVFALRRARVALVAGAAACSPALSPAPQSTLPAADSRTTLLTRLGDDTLAVEQYTRTATSMEGVLVTRSPAPQLVRYAVQLGPDALPVSVEFSQRRGDGSLAANAAQSTTIRFRADSVALTARRAAGDTSRTIAASSLPMPYASGSWGLMELAMARLLAMRSDSATFGMVPLNFGVRASTPLPVRLIGRDSVRITWFGNPVLGLHDGRGGILALDGRRTTQKVRVDRVASADLEAIGARWQAAGAIGRASPHDSVIASVGPARVRVDYGRPALRGRDVWVNGVLGDTLWRTGADSATFLSTDRDLVIGGVSVPAGRYSLWTAWTPDGYQLVINRQTGQWGTVYTRSMDLARVPLRSTEGPPPAERFTITIEPAGASEGALVLAWGTRRLTVPLLVK